MDVELPPLPPLPEPLAVIEIENHGDGQRWVESVDPEDGYVVFAAATMRAFAREFATQAVLAERERLAKMCEGMMDPADDGWDSCLREVASSIRNSGEG